MPSWHHLVIYLAFFFVGGYVISKMPTLNVVELVASKVGM